jgi:hypothetical protein
MMQQQAQMAAMEHQAHQQRLQAFQDWQKNHAAAGPQQATGGASHIPESPAAFAAWYNTQRHNKARNKSYDPAYDKYRAFEKSQPQSRHHRPTPAEASASASGSPQPKDAQRTDPANPQAVSAVATTPLQPNPQASNPATPHPSSPGTGPLGANPLSQLAQAPLPLSRPTPQPIGPLQTTAPQALASQTPNPQSPANPQNPSATAPTAPGSQPAGHPPHSRAYMAGGVGAIGRGRLPWAVDQGIISHLRTAYGKLQAADHDYAGHRARAANHVVGALRHLGATSLPRATLAPALGRLPQAQSDSLLRDALFRLNTVEGHLMTRTNPAAHHRSARASVAAAIRDLDLALSIR